MPALEFERAELAKAEHDIAAGEQRITEQLRRIEELERDGKDTTAAVRLLETLQGTLAEWRLHREAILQEIERAEDHR
jgi:hypothetical protein